MPVDRRIVIIVIKPVDIVCNLRILIGSKLMMQHRVSRVAQTSFHLLVAAFVLACLNYCSVALAGVPASAFAQDQSVVLSLVLDLTLVQDQS